MRLRMAWIVDTIGKYWLPLKQDGEELKRSRRKSKLVHSSLVNLHIYNYKVYRRRHLPVVQKNSSDIFNSHSVKPIFREMLSAIFHPTLLLISMFSNKDTIYNVT